MSAKPSVAISIDPLPGVAPALLNSADIRAYQRLLAGGGTPLLFPFDDTKLKSASYEVTFIGKMHYWIGGKRFREEIELDQPFTLRKNTIVYFEPTVQFQLPDYMAVRFNLTITMVHRGLLLGTGPLVDPGFEGRLLIPLHNLTTTEYTLIGGDGFIWVEFTKVSPVTGSHKTFQHNGSSFSEQFIQFPLSKKNKTADQYFAKANKGNPIESSLGALLEDANRTAKKVVALRNRLYTAAALAFVVSAITLVWPVFTLIHDLNRDAESLHVDVDAAEKKNALEHATNTTLQNQVDTLRKEATAKSAEIAALRTRVNQLSAPRRQHIERPQPPS